MNNQENGGWAQVPVTDIREEMMMHTDDPDDDLAFFSLLDRVIFLKYENVDHYFSEVSGKEPEDLPMAGNKWFTVYDSSPLHGLRLTPANEYNILEVAHSDTHIYFAISAFGSSFASALTEYVRVPYSPPELVSRFLSK